MIHWYFAAGPDCATGRSPTTRPKRRRTSTGDPCVGVVGGGGRWLFSHPGYVVVRRVLGGGSEVTPGPGPSSLLAVLSASALAIYRFAYVVFFPRRSAARQTELRRLTDRRETF